MALSRREFLIHGTKTLCLTSMLGCTKSIVTGDEPVKEFGIYPGQLPSNPALFSDPAPVVSIAKIPEKASEGQGIEYAVTRALELIGGIGEATAGKERILLKPNLVNGYSNDTTHPKVVEALSRLMRQAGKEVTVGEAGAAAAANIDVSLRGYVCRTRDEGKLKSIQADIFERTGYTDLSNRCGIPLVNLHLGDLSRIEMPDNFVYKTLMIHKSLADADLVCSVPMMKTHGLAGVTLGLKNIGIGCYPGMVYGTVRSLVHREGLKVEPTGTSAVTIDMVRANRMGLTVIDATTAMQGQGPSTRGGGKLVEMNLIIAGTNPLATDMVAAAVMGFAPEEIDTFHWAWKAGMGPRSLEEITIAGLPIASVRRPFQRPRVVPYSMLDNWYGPPCS